MPYKSSLHRRGALLVQVAQVAQVVPDYRETQGQVVLWGQVDLVVLVDLVELRAPTD